MPAWVTRSGSYFSDMPERTVVKRAPFARPVWTLYLGFRLILGEDPPKRLRRRR